MIRVFFGIPKRKATKRTRQPVRYKKYSPNKRGQTQYRRDVLKNINKVLGGY